MAEKRFKTIGIVPIIKLKPAETAGRIPILFSFTRFIKDAVM